MAQIIDISRPLQPDCNVWPGDKPFEHWRTSAMADGADCDVSAYAGSTHVATHVDAPSHYIPGGATIDQLDLSIFFGEALVANVTTERIGPSALAAALARRPQRLLLRTAGASGAPGLTIEAAERVTATGVRLIGVDAASIAVDEQTTEVHRVLLRGGTIILEGLDLTDVEPGIYTLTALPIKLTDLEAAPVRAALIDVS